MRGVRWAALAPLLLVTGAPVRADEPSALPVREVTVFKDGHAFVVAEGKLPVKNEVATLDTLPQPVLGTFWPYAAQPGVRLASVTARYQEVAGTRPAQSLRELFAANVGKTAVLHEHEGQPYSARIVGVSGENPGVLLVETEKGVRALNPDLIRDITFGDGITRTLPQTSQKPELKLQLQGARDGTAQVGVMYLQKGLRWIPSYRIDLDGKGQAKVKLQATLVNELVDLDDVTANLVVGVPSIAFADQTDPIALQQTVAQLSPYFRADARTSNALINGQMSQMGGFGGGMGGPGAPPPAPEVASTERSEDLFVFTVKNIRLKRGERMTLPIAEFTLPYKNVYTLELVAAPTRPLYGGYDPSAINAELARLLARPRAKHKIRLTNDAPYPITTAPALLMSQGRVIAQGTTTYAARGGEVDVTLTDANEITVKRTDVETKRTENALNVDGNRYTRVDMDGNIELNSYLPEPALIEVTRYVLGKIDEAKASGAVSALDPLADDILPDWWNGAYGNQWERIRFTGLGKVFWKTTLPPGGKTAVNLGYVWHYFTR